MPHYAAKSKYSAQPTEVDGIRFHSRREAKRYMELRLLEKAGEIRDLRLQPEFLLLAPDHHWDITFGENGFPVVGKYRADFSYFDNRSSGPVVEDVKGFKTPLYKWKKRHVEVQYGITIRET